MKVLSMLWVIALLLCASPTMAQDAEVLEPDQTLNGELPADEFYRAKVIKVIVTDQEVFDDGTTLPYQVLQAELLTGPEQGTVIEFEHGTELTIRESQLLQERETFVLGKSYKVDGTSYYFVADKYRLNTLLIFTGLFVLLVASVAGRRGILAFLGLALSLVILAGFVVPQILNGTNPLLVTLIGSTLIALTSLYIAHGVSLRTTVALASTLATLSLAASLSLIAVHAAKLSGLGSEEAYILQFGQTAVIDLRGLLLAGMLIGALGVLDDVTTAQVAAVAELKLANPALRAKELYQRALNIGREHILSLVNTLVLAYAGASLPVFLFLVLNKHYPLWMTLNGEFLAEEIVRTLVGSSALVLAVPITTAIAASVFARRAAAAAGQPHHH